MRGKGRLPPLHQQQRHQLQADARLRVLCTAAYRYAHTLPFWLLSAA
jgi:hypothetical protein